MWKVLEKLWYVRKHNERSRTNMKVDKTKIMIWRRQLIEKLRVRDVGKKFKIVEI